MLFGMLSVGCGGSVFVFVLLCITMCPFYFCNHLEEVERELFALLLMSYRCHVTVYGVVGWSSVCYCVFS